jgi:polysaccharide deacetylase 2 family uncharacterized protein YibQ
VATDDLNTPLGLNKKPPRFSLPPLFYAGVAGVLFMLLATFVIWAFQDDVPLGGEPMVVVHADVANTDGDSADKKPSRGRKADPVGKGGERGAAASGAPRGGAPATDGAKAEGKVAEGTEAKPDGKTAAQDAAPQDKAAGRGEQVVTIIDGKSGARQEVKIPGSDTAVANVDPQLIEMTPNGPVPRISGDGLRPAQAYAKPVPTKINSPQIAVVVTGLGISANTTAEAINKLPGPITLAFAPYAGDLERLAGKARGLGHELLLQIPMEPFDYPENDPGPQTLVTSLTPEQNIDRLQWLLSRLQGYVGVTNQMGARFTASELSLSPILREVSRRGLVYVDDGNSPRSLAGQIAGGSGLPFTKSNVALDAVPSAVEIDRALARLEAAARENGLAVGFAMALPVSIERIALWAKAAEGRGFTLVPISMAAARGKST